MKGNLQSDRLTMQQKEAEARGAIDLMTAIREDIELKRRNILFLSLMKG